jgi:hypothetical protein
VRVTVLLSGVVRDYVKVDIANLPRSTLSPFQVAIWGVSTARSIECARRRAQESTRSQLSYNVAATEINESPGIAEAVPCTGKYGTAPA